MSGSAYHETFLYRHLEEVAVSSESMLIRNNAKSLVEEMDEKDTEAGNPKPEPAPSEDAATVV